MNCPLFSMLMQLNEMRGNLGYEVELVNENNKNTCE